MKQFLSKVKSQVSKLDFLTGTVIFGLVSALVFIMFILFSDRSDKLLENKYQGESRALTQNYESNSRYHDPTGPRFEDAKQRVEQEHEEALAQDRPLDPELKDNGFKWTKGLMKTSGSMFNVLKNDNLRLLVACKDKNDRYKTWGSEKTMVAVHDAKIHNASTAHSIDTIIIDEQVVSVPRVGKNGLVNETQVGEVYGLLTNNLGQELIAVSGEQQFKFTLPTKEMICR